MDQEMHYEIELLPSFVNSEKSVYYEGFYLGLGHVASVSLPLSLSPLRVLKVLKAPPTAQDPNPNPNPRH